MHVNWAGTAALAAAIAAAAGMGPAPRSAGAAQSEPELRPGSGREVVAEHCLECHDANLITGPRMSRSQWDRIIREMVEYQGMVEPTPENRRIILEYLVETQSPEP